MSVSPVVLIDHASNESFLADQAQGVPLEQLLAAPEASPS